VSAPVRRTAAASFRCRRRRFRAPLTVVLALLTVLLLTGLYVTRHRGYESYYAEACAQAMDELLLLQMHWETEPPAVRWVTGYLDETAFCQDHQLYAAAAQRDGYLDDLIRLRMVMACFYNHRAEEARAWERGITDDASLAWCRHLRESGSARAAVKEFQQTVAGENPADPRASDLPGTAAGTYQSVWLSNALILAVMAAGLPFVWSLVRLLLRRGHAPGWRRRLVARWTPLPVTGAWVRAEWLFLFGGLALIVLDGLAMWGHEPDAPAAVQRMAEGYDEVMGVLHESVWSNVIFSLLLTAPVFLMVYWLTPGFHSTLRIFGIRRCPLSGGLRLRMELAALTLVGALYIIYGVIEGSFGLTDPRDGWSREDGHFWEGILYGCILAPFVEEFVFRGFLFTAFRNRWGTGPAALLSSLLFAVLHGYTAAGTVLMVLFGLLMCMLYHRTGTLRLPLMVHAMTNLLLTW